MKHFIKQNTIISVFWFFSVFIVLAYMFSIDFNKCIMIRVDNIARDMRELIDSLAQIYLSSHTGKVYTEDDMKKILNQLHFEDDVRVVDVSRTTPNLCVYFKVREWMRECIRRVEDEIDKIYKYYPADISTELMEVMDNILTSSNHTTMKTLLCSPNDVNLSCEDIFLYPYYKLICQLENIKDTYQ